MATNKNCLSLPYSRKDLPLIYLCVPKKENKEFFNRDGSMLKLNKTSCV